jgi:hypothetical protein
MPFRLDAEKYGEFRAKIQFTTAAWMPYQIYKACQATGILSNTAYCQIALCEKLAKDLDLDLDQLLASLPKRRGMANWLFDPRGIDTPLPGPAPQGERNAANARIVVGRYGMGNSDQEVR